MKTYCTIVPNIGADIFRKLKKDFGQNTARKVFLTAIHPQFKEDYKGSLSLTSEGVPTYESIMSNKVIRDLIGDSKMLESLNKKHTPVDNTRDNYAMLMEEANHFNNSTEDGKQYIALVTPLEGDKLTIKYQKRNEGITNYFNSQYSAFTLNRQLENMFKDAGVTIGHLTAAEMKAGRIGITDFSAAKDIANGFATMIRVANNMEGEVALTEEFAHMIIGINREAPLVERGINILANNEEALRNILGDTYDDTVEYYNGDMDLVAEEVMGHLLRDNLKEDKIEVPNKSLFRRAINWIVNRFKRYKLSDVERAIKDADNITKGIAKNIKNGTITISREDIRKSARDASFNALANQQERNIGILKEAQKTEVKRGKIVGDPAKKRKIRDTIAELNSYTTETSDTVKGLILYANGAISELRGLHTQLDMINSGVITDPFPTLRAVKMYIDSYAPFINRLTDALVEEEKDEDNMFLKEYMINGDTFKLREIYTQLKELSDTLGSRFGTMIYPAFAEFLKPFLGEKIKIEFGARKGQIITIDKLLKSAEEDISFFDMWLDSAAQSADALIQIINKSIMKAKDDARFETMDYHRRIIALRKEAEGYGITSFEWLFEKDSNGNKSGNYVGAVNQAEFEKDLKEFNEQLDLKYGKNPSGEKAKKRLAERNEWRRVHCESIYSDTPSEVYYKSKDYEKIIKNNRQKIIYDKILNLKRELDEKYPAGRTSELKAIQIRKGKGERFLRSLSSPSTMFESIREAVASAWLEKEDDDAVFGEKTKLGLRDFQGNEFYTLPAIYTTRLSNPNEISDDVFGSLIAYAFATSTYEQMAKIVDPLEIGREIMKRREVAKTRGEKKLVEKVNFAGESVKSVINVGKSNILQRYEDLLESQVYGKYLKDSGTVSILGKEISKNKATSQLLKVSTTMQLGLNWLANLANVATGLSMQNIEAFTGQYFNAKELAKADKIYASNVLGVVGELSAREKKNKVSLVFEAFNVKQDYNRRAQRTNQKRNLLRKAFGGYILFMGQEAGDHWLYGRTAIAMMLRKQVLLNGKKMSLWDALQPVDSKYGKGIKELNLKDIKELDGTPFDVGDFSRQIASINHDLFGIYNDDDMNAANRVALGRLLQQYRKWMKTQYNRRFEKSRHDAIFDTTREGYYRTAGRILKELLRGQIQWSELKSLDEEEKYNLRRALFEMVQFLAVVALTRFIDWPDDKNRAWLLKLSEYSLQRLKHELGGLAPSTIMPQELLKTVGQPFPSAGAVKSVFDLASSALDPADWFDADEHTTGAYKGLSTLEKNFIKAPIPVAPQIRQISKFTGDIDNSINYYVRPSVF